MSKKLDETIKLLLVFWTGLCLGWLLFDNPSFFEVLSTNVIGLAIIIVVGAIIKLLFIKN